MAGEFVTYNKELAGVYFRRQTIVSNLTDPSIVGSVALPLPLKWGADVVEITAKDIITNDVYNKIGLNQNDQSVLPIILALENCSKVYVCRNDTGGVKASATIYAGLTATARYAGSFGNNITVEIAKKTGETNFTVITYLSGKVVDRQVISNVLSLKDNSFVTFTGTGALEVKAGVSLADGTDGNATNKFGDSLESLVAVPVDVLAIFDGSDLDDVKEFIEDTRVNLGKDMRAVIISDNINDEYFVKLKNQGFTKDGTIIDSKLYAAYMAGIQAGSTGATSNTYREIVGATDLINPSSGLLTDIKAGYLVLGTRTDGAIIIEKDVNSLPASNNEDDETLRDNRNIRALIGVKAKIRDHLEKYVIGKIDGNDLGLDTVKSSLTVILKEAESDREIRNFSPESDIEVSFGATNRDLIVNMWIQTAVSIEKVYVNILQRI